MGNLVKKVFFDNSAKTSAEAIEFLSPASSGEQRPAAEESDIDELL